MYVFAKKRYSKTRFMFPKNVFLFHTEFRTTEDPVRRGILSVHLGISLAVLCDIIPLQTQGDFSNKKMNLLRVVTHLGWRFAILCHSILQPNNQTSCFFLNEKLYSQFLCQFKTRLSLMVCFRTSSSVSDSIHQ